MPFESDLRTTRRNFQLGVANGLLFTLAETLLDPTLVLVAFVGHLTQSPLWLGLVSPLRDGAWFLPQLWVSGYLQSQPRKLPLYRLTSSIRIVIWLALALAPFLIQDRQWLLLAFFGLFGLYALAAGFGGLSFLEVVGKTISPARRPAFFAWRMTLGGLASLGASGVVRWMLSEASPLTFPQNFGALFLLGWPFAAAGLWVFTRLTEPADAMVKPPAQVTLQLARAAAILRQDHNYRYFLLLRVLLLVAGAAVPFFAVYVRNELGGAQSMVGVYLAVYTVANLLSNVVFGRFAAQIGNRRTLLIGALASLIMSALVAALALSAKPLSLSGWVASLWLVPVFAFSGVRDSGLGVSAQSLLLEIAPRTEWSLYLGFTNSLLGLVLLATGLSGVIVARLGFWALLGLAGVANLGALVAALRLREGPTQLTPLTPTTNKPQ